MKKEIRIFLIFAGFILAVGFPFLFDWESGNVWLKAAISVVVAAAGACLSSSNIQKDSDEKFDTKPTGVEFGVALIIFVIAILISILPNVLQW